jgi:hypothetical protein
MRCLRAAFGLLVAIECLENKKGPEEAPCAPPVSGWRLAIPGGAPGYDDDKEFGNFITHMTAQTSQRLREHTAEAPKVKPRQKSRSISSLAGFIDFGEGEFWVCSHAGADPRCHSRPMTGLAHSDVGTSVRRP